MGGERIVIDTDACISCGACVAVCPHNALELDENGKARVIWDKCESDFECVKVCPVNCIWPASQAPAEAKTKGKWYRFSGALSEDLEKEYREWLSKYGIRY